MSTWMKRDALLRPELFVWDGPVARERLDAWARERRLHLPEALMELWEATGGGELFESETLLGPFRDRRLGDDVDGVNELHRGRGMDARYVIVHVGIALTAIRQGDGRWVVLDPATYAERAEYASLDDWYASFVRAEFAARYGLPARAG